MTQLGQGRWTRGPPEVPANLNHSHSVNYKILELRKLSDTPTLMQISPYNKQVNTASKIKRAFHEKEDGLR